MKIGFKSAINSPRMNCKRQSHHGKYVCGLPTVKTCYVFAIVNAVFVSFCGLGILCWLGLLAYLAASFGVSWNDELFILTTVLLTAGGYLASAISAIFAIMLLVGIRKKNHNLVKAYLFYGIVVEILLILATVVFVAIYFHDIFRGHGCAVYICVSIFCICVLYVFILRLVVDTYVVLRNGHSARAHRTDVQLLFIPGTDGELQLLPLAR